MRNAFILTILLIILGALIWYKTPASSGLYYTKAINEYNSGKYDNSIELFDHILKNDPSNVNARFYLVRALSKVEPTYSVQKMIFEMANSSIEDESKNYAKNLMYSTRNKLIEGVEDNYIFNAISGKDVIRWDIKTFPLKVYIDPNTSVPKYYTENIKKALDQWTQRTGFIKFTIVNKSSDADIFITFNNSTTTCTNNECKYAVAYTEPTISGTKLKQMKMTFHNKKPNNEDYSPLEIYNTALHELGHALGIMGHSDNSDDVMYSNNNKTNDIYSQYRSEFQYLSLRDLKTLALLYKLAPTITNTNDTENKSYYYTQLILGAHTEILEKKLAELQKYIQNYPNLAAGYINIAGIYADMGNTQEALDQLHKAENLTKNPDELYLIEYNRAVINYNIGEYNEALQCAKNAKQYKTTVELTLLLKEIIRVRN